MHSIERSTLTSYQVITQDIEFMIVLNRHHDRWFTAIVELRQCCDSEKWQTGANGGEQ
jgi:hypothetical protein